MIEPGTMVDVARIHCRIAPHDWPFAGDAAVRIEHHWTELRRLKPSLFDGRVLLSRNLTLGLADGGDLTGEAFEVRYSAFLAWRDFGFPDENVHNVFAMPALRSRDGAFLLGRMAASTANGGKLYFPAGTPEPSDAGADGVVDFDANILRELEEETGLTSADVEVAAHWTLVFAGPLVACMKVVQSPLSADGLVARVAETIAAQDQPELVELVPVRRPADFDATHMPAFMLRYLGAVLPT